MANVIPNFLNFNRSLSPSEGFMYGVSAEGNLIPVEITTRGIRSSISNYSNVYGSKGKAEDKINSLKDPKNANLQVIETAFLPPEAKKLLVRYSLIVQANSLAPSACNDPSYLGKLVELSKLYADCGGYEALSKRYAWNVLNGRMLWRNRFLSEKQIIISFDDKQLIFDTDNMSIFRFNEDEMPANFTELADRIALALRDPNAILQMEIDVSGIVPVGAEVFPSQEYVPEGEKDKNKKDESGKKLSAIEINFEGRRLRQATMHSQKIGNALRTIDEWHSRVEETGATPVESYGYVQHRAEVLRVPSADSKSVYDLLADIDTQIEVVRAATNASELPGDIHYLIAMLIRGGVFSGESKK